MNDITPAQRAQFDRDRHADDERQKAALVAGVSEQQPRAARCAGATGSLPGRSVDMLLYEWENQARALKLGASALSSLGHKEAAITIRAQAGIWAEVARQLRAEVEYVKKRQPEENIRSQPHAEDNA